jgi:hypothetical protein
MNTKRVVASSGLSRSTGRTRKYAPRVRSYPSVQRAPVVMQEMTVTNPSETLAALSPFWARRLVYFK